jgi:NADPH-dependent curcumin reductase CurA
LTTFCKTVEIPKITVSVAGDGRTTNATMRVEGYASKGDAEVITASAGAIGAIAGAAAKAAAGK